MVATHTDFELGRRWLVDMGEAASGANISIQYCMTLPRELLQVTCKVISIVGNKNE